ncbi:hypothetical protein [Fischerella sp. PCC 9605]|uniref:hypothetical protein n=1 Tax=Fischerella sp. PCC 9605 TaxID=1173024 RepID=UPI00047DD953|nr:hypothetical protein [Fischerella sp. PCC 9605]
MNQNPLVDSSVKSSKTPELKPALAAALSSLEVELDQELARYRRTRFTHKTSLQPRLGISMSGKLQQLTAIATTEVKTQHAPSANNSEKISLPLFPSTTPPISESESNTQEQVPTTVKENSSQQHTLEMPSTSAVDKKQTTPIPNSASIVPATIGENKSQNLVSQNSTPKPPDDYLESSEALLRSLAEEQPPTNKRSNSSDSLLSPLGIGSMLLLLMSSLTLGYVVFNPKSLPHLSLNGLFKKNTLDSATNTEGTGADSNIKTVAEPELTPIPKNPNLAASEFPEVKNPNDVVGLQPKPKLTPIATSTPSPIPATTTIAQQVQPTSAPMPPIATTTTPTKPTPTPAPSPQNLDDAEIKPLADGFYHVVIDNQSVELFAKIRQVIPDAYLASDNKLIYLGAFKTKQQVKQHMQMLQAKGINAKVQQP